METPAAKVMAEVKAVESERVQVSHIRAFFFSALSVTMEGNAGRDLFWLVFVRTGVAVANPKF